MRSLAAAITLALTLLLTGHTSVGAQSAPQSRAAEPIVARCMIGKPSYCLKYGGTLCEKGTTKKNAKAACAKWTEGCLTCHSAVPTCLNNNRSNVPQSKCDRCRTAWNACMAKNDSRHWPGRLKGK